MVKFYYFHEKYSLAGRLWGGPAGKDKIAWTHSLLQGRYCKGKILLVACPQSMLFASYRISQNLVKRHYPVADESPVSLVGHRYACSMHHSNPE